MDSTLYDRDYYQWLTETAYLLAEGRLSEMDVPNLLDEIEAIGKSQKRAIASYLRNPLGGFLNLPQDFSQQRSVRHKSPLGQCAASRKHSCEADIGLNQQRLVAIPEDVL